MWHIIPVDQFGNTDHHRYTAVAKQSSSLFRRRPHDQSTVGRCIDRLSSVCVPSVRPTPIPPHPTDASARAHILPSIHCCYLCGEHKTTGKHTHTHTTVSVTNYSHRITHSNARPRQLERIQLIYVSVCVCEWVPVRKCLAAEESVRTLADSS